MEYILDITECGDGCPFFSSSNQGKTLKCNHPYLKYNATKNAPVISDKGLMLKSEGKTTKSYFPKKCPLRIENLTIRYKLIL